MKVYVVEQYGIYGDQSIVVGVFSTLDKAQAYADILEKSGSEYVDYTCDISSFIIDRPFED